MKVQEPTPAVIREAQRGSVSAFEVIVTYYAERIYNLALRFMFDREDAHDLAQEIFLRLYMNLPEYDPDRPFKPWFYRLAVNTCINNIRARRQVVVEDPDVLDNRSDDLHANDPARNAAMQDEIALLQRTVAQLPEQYRAVVVLRYLEDMSCEDVAEILQVPVGTVKTWLFRAREILKTKMKGAWVD